MKRLALTVLVLLGLVPSAGAGGPAPIHGIEWRLGGGVTLLRLDATTLKPLRGLEIDLGSATHLLARSPDGRRVLAGGSNVLRVADLRTGRVSRPLHPGGWVPAALWTNANTIVVVTQDELVLVDPQRNEVKRRIQLPGHVLVSRVAKDRLVLVLGPADDIGQLAVATVDATGTLRSRPIAMRGGGKTLRNDERNPIGFRSERPGLAVDAAGTGAVVAGLTTIVHVDLVNLSSATVAVQARRLQKTSEGWERGALWLDAHHVAVFGSNYNGQRPATAVPVHIVDLRDGNATSLDTDATYATKWRSLLLTIGRKVSVFEPDGTLRMHAVDEPYRGQVVAGETFLYVETSGSGRKWIVIDPADGRVVGRRTFTRPMNLVPALAS